MRTISLFTAFLFCLAGAFAESPIRPGDRIAIVGNTFADQLRIHGYLETLLLQHTAKDPVSIRNLGWGGDMLTARDRPTNFPTEESTLTDHQTDVIIACFGMGESFAGEAGIEDFKADLQNFFASHAGKKYNGKSEVRLVLVSPIAYEDLGILTPMRKKRNRELEAYSRAMGEVAVQANIPYVDLFGPSRYFMDEPDGPDMTTNGIHLNDYGYWAISRVIYDSLRPAHLPQPWQITINANAKTTEVSGVRITELERKEDELRFKVTETSVPSLAPPTNGSLPPQLAIRRDTLAIAELAAGNYVLTIDGQAIATASHADWASGIAIDSSPAHQAAEAYRSAVNDKNLQFTYSWKALNQVHIVGERRNSPSGRALPAEVIEFNNLANERDATLRSGIDLKTRQWCLAPVSPQSEPPSK